MKESDKGLLAVAVFIGIYFLSKQERKSMGARTWETQMRENSMKRRNIDGKGGNSARPAY